jgi:hypothetical protein
MVASEPTMLVALALSPRPPHPRPAAAEVARQVSAPRTRRGHRDDTGRRAPSLVDPCDLLLGMERLALRALGQICQGGRGVAEVAKDDERPVGPGVGFIRLSGRTPGTSR